MKNFLGKKLLFITAHPDDESYIAAGTIIKNNKARGESAIICATLGEKGRAHLTKPLSDKKLKEVRRNELAAAARFMKARLHVLNLPDGKLTFKKAEFFKRSVAIIRKERPDVIISFGPDGISGHLDHITAGVVALRIAKKLKIPFFVFARPASLIKASAQWMGARRKFGKYAKKMTYTKPTLCIKVSPASKLKTLTFHGSQIGTAPLRQAPPAVRKHILSKEYFAEVKR